MIHGQNNRRWRGLVLEPSKETEKQLEEMKLPF